ncbi:MAG: hypothetical protein WAV05_17365 [Anaerolineales bacterium]
MGGVVLELGFLPVTILAKQVGGLLARKAQLHDSRMGIKTGKAIQYLVLALRKVAILVTMLDEAIFYVQISSRFIFMAFPA